MRRTVQADLEIAAYPAATFPTGLKVEKSDVKDSAYKPLNKLDGMYHDACAYPCLCSLTSADMELQGTRTSL